MQFLTGLENGATLQYTDSTYTWNASSVLNWVKLGQSVRPVCFQSYITMVVQVFVSGCIQFDDVSEKPPLTKCHNHDYIKELPMAVVAIKLWILQP